MLAFVRAARRLSLPSGRGLAGALDDAGAASFSGRQLQQPWCLAAFHGSAADSAAPATPPAPSLAVEEAAQASGSQQQAEQARQAAAAEAIRSRLPPGQVDFTQRQLMMLFTCGKCNTRAAKAFSKQSYESGVVIVECPGCQSKHLIADHLGWFGQKGTVEQFASERGATVVRRLADGTVELTPEDLLGASLAQEAAGAGTGAGAAAGGVK